MIAFIFLCWLLFQRTWFTYIFHDYRLLCGSFHFLEGSHFSPSPGKFCVCLLSLKSNEAQSVMLKYIELLYKMLPEFEYLYTILLWNMKHLLQKYFINYFNILFPHISPIIFAWRFSFIMFLWLIILSYINKNYINLRQYLWFKLKRPKIPWWVGTQRCHNIQQSSLRGLWGVVQK